MRKLMVLWMLMLAGVLAMSSCNENNEAGDLPDGTMLSPDDVPATVLAAFEKQYPDARQVSWMKKNGYAVAMFTNIGEGETVNSAWFEWDNGVWGMTEYDIIYASLPDNVKLAFENSSYGQQPWIRNDEVDVLERNNSEMLYVIEVEKKENSVETEVDLYYTSDGILVKEIIDAEQDNDFHEFLPQTPAGNIEEWLMQEFPDARIIDMDVEKNGTEVEILSGGLKHEILFDASSAWLETKTEYGNKNLSLVPAVILQTAQTKYPDARVEEVEKYVTLNNGEYYCVEMENRYDDDIKLYIDNQGTVIERPVSGNGSANDVTVNEEIKVFINGRYPGAIVIDRDYDDGYLEIDIMHENIEKELRFNGKNEWIDATWEITENQLPEAVKLTVVQNYVGYRIEDIEVVDSELKLLYKIELEGYNDRDLKLWIKENGEVEKVYED